MHPRKNFGKKEKKFGEPPHPLKNWRTPPRKIRDPPGPDHPPPLLTESQTRVNILPWPNFVAAGKKKKGICGALANLDISVL